MKHYHLHLLDDNDQVVSNVVYYGPDDLAALTVGEKFCKSQGVEIWDDVRQVARLKKGGEALNERDRFSL